MKLRKKQSRAVLRARSRKGRVGRSNRWFAAAIAVVVVVGVLGVYLTVADRQSASASGPKVGDHWHAGIAAYVCGSWLSNPPTFETEAGNANVRAGIHTHGDGFVHIHPFTSAEGGVHATLGEFLTYGGWSATNDSLKLWAGPPADRTKTTWKNGDRCPDASGQPGKGEPGKVVFEVNCKVETSNPSDWALRDQQILAIGFVAKGDSMPTPPNAQSAPSNDGSPTGAFNQKSCAPTAVNNPGVPDTSATGATATTGP
jgi:hypothetical protein